MDTEVDPSDLDVIYGLLSDSDRRYVLYYFLENERSTIDRIALELAGWKTDAPLESVSDDEKETVSMALRHNHLPRLSDHGLVTFDQRSGDVAVGTEFDSVRSTVKRAREEETPDSVTNGAAESFLSRHPVPESTGEDH
ncbi:DUF7344 domain-containing protein [Natrinema marinum]|uniref:DUF7344 domain-containing protein n=1 Tax=Natrinema marinum TaxID=2961598 RepID=UPI003CE5BDF5